MRVLLWHGWLLEGSGSSIYAARSAEVLRADGHDVALVCQERHPERYGWIDASATVDPGGVGELVPNPAARPASGRCVLLRPSIGSVLPVFVLDEYEGFTVRRFVDLDDATIATYLEANVAALSQVVSWHRTEAAVAGHAIPGAVVAARSLHRAGVPYVAKIHGSDLEFAIREQRRLAALASEGLRPARAVVGASRDVLERCAELLPDLDRPLGPVVAPGVDVGAFHPRPRREALLDVASRLRADPDVARGRPASLDAEVLVALERRDAAALDALAEGYDQAVPERDAADALERLTEAGAPVVGSFGKLIPPKGVHLLLEAMRRTSVAVETLVVGFGSFREWLGAYALAAREGDVEAARWLAASMPDLDVAAEGRRVATTFTGRLDHRYAGDALAAMDVLVVPSVLEEAFGMVTIEGVAAGALPLVARHSGLAEIAEALEGDAGEPGLFSYERGPGAAGRLAEGLDRLLSMPGDHRRALSEGASAFVAQRWSWRATAQKLLEAVRAR